MKIFFCGDSTAASYNPSETRMVGWGQLLGDFLPGIPIVNLAMAGRSTRTFLAEGRLQPAEQAGAGDLILVQFAHNDENEKKPERYAAPRTAYSENLRYFIRFARERNAVPCGAVYTLFPPGLFFPGNTGSSPAKRKAS